MRMFDAHVVGRLPDCGRSVVSDATGATMEAAGIAAGTLR